jgi:fatty acid amide hydrolase
MTISTSSKAELTTLSAAEMAALVSAGQVSSRELVDAHISRIEQVNPALNAMILPLFGQARAEAAASDEQRARGERLGPLHGVPITVKECFHVAGTASTEGIGRFAHELIGRDGVLVARLRRAGAVILGKTNVPQLMLMHETDNPVFGRTNNPWDLDRSPGGSSGGEAALIAAGASPLGLANDLGGSIRFPAHSCGICGLKPTTLRLTNAGARANLHGMEAIQSQPGPLARRVADLRLAMEVLTQSLAGEIDPQMAPVPFSTAVPNVRGMKIGMWVDDGFFRASPAIRRAVEECAQVLTELGARVEPFHPPEMPYVAKLYLALLSADGGADAARLLGRSERDWRMRRLLMLGRMPKMVRSALAIGLGACGQNRTADLLGWIGRRTADEYWQLSHQRALLAERTFELWERGGYDAFICPPHALPALRHGASAELTVAAGACYWANLLGVPAGVVPVTRVRADEQCERPDSRDAVERTAAATDAGSIGLPIGVQVVARPWREDVVLSVMQSLEEVVSDRADFPRTPVHVATNG